MGLTVTLFFSTFTKISGLDPTKEKLPYSLSSKFKKNKKGEGFKPLNDLYNSKGGKTNFDLNLCESTT